MLRGERERMVLAVRHVSTAAPTNMESPNASPHWAYIASLQHSHTTYLLINEVRNLNSEKN